MPNRGQTIDVPELHLFHGTPYPTTKNDKTTVLIWSMDAWERPKARLRPRYSWVSLLGSYHHEYGPPGIAAVGSPRHTPFEEGNPHDG